MRKEKNSLKQNIFEPADFEIGGYFGLESGVKFNDISGFIALNCARNCLRYVIRAFDIKEIYIPFYTCPVVWQSVKKEKCVIKFYHIDMNFMPETDFPKDAYILYTNYFGVCAKNVKLLANKYKNLIVDNAHAFYMPKYGIASFNSIRKFFGVPDGALLSSDKVLNEIFEKDTSYQRFSYLLKRVDKNAKFGYEDFQLNEVSFNNEPIKKMSNLTAQIFQGINTERAKTIRLENYKILDNGLKGTNELTIDLDIDDVPIAYPYLLQRKSLREKLIKNKIFVPTYWNSIGAKEKIFQKYLLLLPIDQRYSTEDMNRILDIIKSEIL